jgi:predicted Zn-dependent protease
MTQQGIGGHAGGGSGRAGHSLPDQDVVELGLEMLGPDRGTVLVEHSTVANLRWANSTLTTNGLSAGREVRIVVHPTLADGVGSGTAGGVVSDRADLAALVARARAAAQGAGPAQDAAPEVPARPASPDWALPAASTSAEALEPVSAVLAEVLPDPSMDHFGYAQHSMTTTYLGTSAGLRLRHDQPAARFEISGKSAGRSRSAWAARSGRHFADLDLAGAAAEVATGLAAQATPIDVAPGRQRVVLSPSAAADLLVNLLWSAGARDAAEGRSAFSRAGGGTRVGEQFTHEPFWLRSDPAAPGLECADHVLATTSSSVTSPFDAGLPLTGTDWIADGTLRALLTTRQSAGLAGLANTPYIDNLLGGVSGRTGTLEELAERVGDGLLVTCLWYIREVDAQTLLVTGLTRDGVYVIRDGEVVGAAGNFRFNDSPLGMLARISDAGQPVDCLPREWADWFTRARVAPLAVEDFNLSTASEAV